MESLKDLAPSVIAVVVILKITLDYGLKVHGWRNGKNGKAKCLLPGWELHQKQVDRLSRKFSDDPPRKHTEQLSKLTDIGERQVKKLGDIETAIKNNGGKV